VQRVLDQVIRAVEFLFGFTLAAGWWCCLPPSRPPARSGPRIRHHACRGARASLLRQVQRAELAGVGLLAGFLASGGGVVVGWALARYVFEFEWTVSLWVPLAGALTGRRAGPGGRLVGPARCAAPPGGGHPAARGRMSMDEDRRKPPQPP
jgi:putative ABC transport system permease protein